MEHQTTLKRKINLKGIGVHSGEAARCAMHPAPANTGIVFVRSDLRGAPQITADISKVVRTDLSTTLGQNGVVLATVEHLMAAFYGMGVDNAVVEVSGHEVPIMDGSAHEFVDAIEDTGIRTLNVPRKTMYLRKKISVRSADKWIVAKPAEEFSITGSINFGHKMIGEQSFNFNWDHCFKKELSRARTFGFLREVEYLHKKGLALGGSLENAIVLDEERVLNAEGLRYKNEFVRHKILDALGDFFLLGMRLVAEVEVHKGGHQLHTGFIRKILEEPSNYEIVEQKQVVDVTSYQEDQESDELAAAMLAHAY